MTIHKVSIYKEKPMLAFLEEEDSKYPLLSFGMAKAEIILQNVDVIRDYYNQHSTEYKAIQATQAKAKAEAKLAKQAKKDAKENAIIQAFLARTGKTLA